MSAPDLGGPVLKAVSRSFYLSVRVLPRQLRSPVGLAYLLARASDTIADSPTAPVGVRLRHLASFDQIVQGGTLEQLPEIQRDIRPEHPGELQLIGRLEECLQWLHALPEGDRDEIRTVLKRITHGQTLDLQRFPEAGAGTGIASLKTAAELEEYTYLVAGCVGEFWTRISLQHLKGYAEIDEAVLIQLGIDYGKGLQLVNILRDTPADLRQGRSYLPAEQLSAAGMSPGDLLTRPESALEIFTHWLNRAESLLESGREYIRAIRPARARIACFLPWHLGRETLYLMRHHNPLETSTRVKVSRGTVRVALLQAPIVAFSNLPLRR